MAEVVSKSLQKIVKGSTVVFIGTIVSLLLGFLARIIMVKFSTQAEYGVYSLALTIISICTTVSALGLEDGVARYIAYLRGNDEKKNIQNIIYSSIIFVLLASTLTTVMIFVQSTYIATKIFNEPDMSLILQIMAISIPLIVLMNLIVSIYRGFDNISVKTYFYNILRPCIYLLLLGIAVLLNSSFVEMVSIYVISLLVTFLALIIYFIRNAPIELILKKVHIDNNAKKLLQFSIPLLTISILFTIMSWTDTLMLGYFKNAETVATYNAAYPLANLLSIGINSIGFLYVPIISNLYSRDSIKEIGAINESSTKWCLIVTIPIFFILIMFPEFILNMLYNFQYVKANSVLQILSLGFVMNSLFGLNYYTLMAIGKSRILMNCSLISTIINIFLNLILIPPFGMFGAAIASATSFTLIEIYMTLKLYQFLKIHPFTKMYLRFITVTTLLLCVCYILRNLFVQTLFTVAVYYIIFLIAYVIMLLCSKSLDKEDIEILVQIGKKLVNLSATSKALLNKLALKNKL